MTDDIEWGEWVAYADLEINGICDYQYQYVGGVAQWRVRKAPPVVVTIGAFVWTQDEKPHITTANVHCSTLSITFTIRDGEVDTSVAPTVGWVK